MEVTVLDSIVAGPENRAEIKAHVVGILGALVVLAGLLVLGCGDSSGGSGGPPLPSPEVHNPLVNYASTGAPVTSSVPYSVPVWARAELLAYVPHPSVRLTRSVLRPGEDNTPAQRLLEEVVLTRPDADSRVSPHAAGPPPGWTVVAMVGRITLSVRVVITTDQNGATVQATQIDQEAEGLTDCARRVIWCRATDDAVTPEGEALMGAYGHELLHAYVYEDALARGLSHAAAERESKAIDGSAP